MPWVFFLLRIGISPYTAYRFFPSPLPMSADKDQLRSEAINLTALQGERLREIGAYLRQTRLDRQVSLEDIRQQTFIQVYQLHAIETGDLQVLPEPVYVQGFIKKYAIALGLNGQELATSFPVSRPR